MPEQNVGVRRTKPTIGGRLPPIQLSDLRSSVFEAVASELVPGGDGFPPAGETGVVSYAARYVAPAGEEPRWFPFLGEDALGRRLDDLGRPFLDTPSAGRTEALRRLEREEPGFFTLLRDLVYLAYYAQPEVVRAISRGLEAGRDYRGTPQPFGYTDVLAEWEDELIDRVRGSYTATADVVRVRIPEGIAFGGANERGGDR